MSEAFKIDRLDLRILAQLQKNGRMTNVDLADAVGLSPSPCLIRVKRLEQAGYIAGYGAHLRLEKLGDTLTVFTEVTLPDHHREDFVRFETAIREVDEMLECHLVSGGYDYLLRFLTRGVNHYQEVIEELLERNIGIEKYFSYIVIKSPFIKTHCPIERLFPHPALSGAFAPSMPDTPPRSHPPARFVRLAETDRPALRCSIDGAPGHGAGRRHAAGRAADHGRRVRDSEFGDGPRAGFCLMGACQDCWVWTEPASACAPARRRCSGHGGADATARAALAGDAGSAAIAEQPGEESAERRIAEHPAHRGGRRRPGRRARRAGAGRRPGCGPSSSTRPARRRPDLPPPAGGLQAPLRQALRHRGREGAGAAPRASTRCATRSTTAPTRWPGTSSAGALHVLHGAAQPQACPSTR